MRCRCRTTTTVVNLITPAQRSRLGNRVLSALAKLNLKCYVRKRCVSREKWARSSTNRSLHPASSASSQISGIPATRTRHLPMREMKISLVRFIRYRKQTPGFPIQGLRREHAIRGACYLPHYARTRVSDEASPFVWRLHVV